MPLSFLQSSPLMLGFFLNRTYADEDHLNPDDEAKVRDLLEYHPKAEEKIGSGIDFIKVIHSSQLSVLQDLSVSTKQLSCTDL